MNRTAQREELLRNLRLMRNHPTANELFTRLRMSLPHISLGTVYRNLDVLSQIGVIHKLASTGEKYRYEYDLSEHYHIRCKKCGAIADVENPELMELIGKMKELLPEIGGDTINLEFTGYCKKCQKTIEKKPEEVR